MWGALLTCVRPMQHGAAVRMMPHLSPEGIRRRPLSCAQPQAQPRPVASCVGLCTTAHVCPALGPSTGPLRRLRLAMAATDRGGAQLLYRPLCVGHHLEGVGASVAVGCTPIVPFRLQPRMRRFCNRPSCSATAVPRRGQPVYKRSLRDLSFECNPPPPPLKWWPRSPTPRQT